MRAVASRDRGGYNAAPMAGLLYLVLEILRWVIIVDAVSSWFRGPTEFPRNITGQITEPLYAPIRSVLGGGGMDFSPLIMLVLLHVGQAMLGH